MKRLGNDKIVIKQGNGIEYIQFKNLLQHGIKHAYTLKREGINFRSDSKEEKESYKKIFESIGLDIKTYVKPQQRHTSKVTCIDKVMKTEELLETDGLITNKENITLVTTNADCILFLFYDPVKKVIANIHSGWRGTFQKIGENAIIKMIEEYKCKPEDIEIYIWPSIRKCHFEVDEEVKNECEEIFKYTEKTGEFIEKGEVKGGKQKYFIDTVFINRILFLNQGIKENNIYDCDICSVCNNDKIRSYRAEGKDFKLATSIISL
ncbi:MAG: peptidoglycan editing factor PgeF [Clostridia bacterium]|nr:peptidoglycan editing factor PgeF [Clostridia bacterium]